jgi:hypothetical protein
MNFHIISDIHLEFSYYSLKSHVNKKNRKGIPDNEEINLNNLRDQENINRLVDIYCLISPNIEREVVIDKINVNVKEYFFILQSKIGKKIERAIQNDNISNQYIISGSRGKPFKILVSRDLVEINY